MTIVRFCACFFLLLGTACGKKQKDIAAQPAPETNQAQIAPNQSSEVTRASVANELPVVTNTPPREAAKVPGQEAYERGVALLRNAQRREDLDAGVTLFREAAEQGNAAAQRGLGVCYFRGIGVAKNPAEAMAWLNKSASQGDADAQFKAASILIRGDGVPQDEPRAIELLRAAAQQGHAEAQYNLAILYSTGKGVPKDSKEAADWFRKAAENGHPTAQSNFGVLHANGELGEKNMEEAVRWWRKAAEQGQSSAQFNLAQALIEGKAVERDLVAAYKWSHLSADQGDRDAARLRNSIAAEISPSELGDALKQAREFKSQLQARRENGQEKMF